MGLRVGGWGSQIPAPHPLPVSLDKGLTPTNHATCIRCGQQPSAMKAWSSCAIVLCCWCPLMAMWGPDNVPHLEVDFRNTNFVFGL